MALSSGSRGEGVRGDARPLVAAGLLLGVGMGGFIDGIVLHQILQWHNMLASQVPVVDLVSSKVNMFWDGLFHAFTWLTTFAGLLLLWRAGSRGDVPWSGRIFAGTLLAGWGLFNLVEGLIDHQLLGIHHVRPGAHQLAWDVGFLVLGALQMVGGWALARTGRTETRARGGRALRPAHQGA
jgi:uncharacterized membrane protein